MDTLQIRQHNLPENDQVCQSVEKRKKDSKKERNKNRLKITLRSATAYVEKVKQIKNTKRFAKLVIG